MAENKTNIPVLFTFLIGATAVYILVDSVQFFTRTVLMGNL